MIRWFSYDAMFLSAAGFVVVGLGLFAFWDREALEPATARGSAVGG